jgi:AhpD family alkylhydroperoxidase
MMSGTVDRAALAHVRHVAPVAPAFARDLVARVYGQMARDFGMFAPPIGLHSPAPRMLAAAWSILRETLLAKGVVDRPTKEAVAAAVSVGNACPYCVDIHGTTLHGLVRGADAVAIAGDRLDVVANPGLRAAAVWARASGTAVVGAGPAGRAPFAAEHAPEYIGVMATFHYLNRMVNVFLKPSPFPDRIIGAARGRLNGLFGWIIGQMARRDCAPGASLDLLPAAPLPPDLSWAAGRSHIAEAFARAAAAVDLAGRRSVPERVRDLVTTRLTGWTGQPIGLSRGWALDATAGLPRAERPVGQLALLVACASYQIDDSIVDSVRAVGAGDDTLVEVASWASLAAARTMAARTATEATRAVDRTAAE